MAKKKAALPRDLEDSLRGTRAEVPSPPAAEVDEDAAHPDGDAESAEEQASGADEDLGSGEDDAADGASPDGADAEDGPPSSPAASSPPSDPDAALRVDPELVQRIENIVQQREHVLALIENTRGRSAKVKPEIFDRVIGDYQRQLAEIEADYEPASQSICQSLMAISALEDKLREEIEQIHDHMVEMRFRCEVGEFPEEDLFPIEAEHQSQLKQLGARMDLIDATYEQCKPFLRAEDYEDATGRPYEVEDAAPEPSADEPDAADDADEEDDEVDGPEAPGHRETLPPEVFTAGARLDAVRLVDSDEPDEGPPTRFEVRPDAVEDGEEGGEHTVAAERLRCYVVHKQQDGGERYFPLGLEPFAIGRHPQNDLVLSDRGISRRHARIVLENTGRYTIADLSSGNGIFVNGTRVHEKSELSNGDYITMGSSTMFYLERLE